MKDHLIKSKAMETSMLEKLTGPELPEGVNVNHGRVAADLIRVRIELIDQLIGEMGPHPASAFQDAMERVRQQFDKDVDQKKKPYKSWRGPTPKGEPSLAKDIRIIFHQLMLEGIWTGEAPVLDPRWEGTDE